MKNSEADFAEVEFQAKEGDDFAFRDCQQHGRAIFTRAQWGVPRSSHQVRPLMRISS
jgi:hypothetical protein